MPDKTDLNPSRLNLGSCTGVAVVDLVATLSTTSDTITDLDMTTTLLNRSFEEIIQITAAVSKSITTLRLNDNNLGDTHSCDELLKILASIKPSVTVLKMRGNFLINKYTKEFSELIKILNAIPKSVIDVDLGLNNNSWYDFNVDEIIQIFAAMPASVKTLSFCDNDIRTKTTDQLVTVFRAFPPSVYALKLDMSGFQYFSYIDIIKILQAIPGTVTCLTFEGSLEKHAISYVPYILAAIPQSITQLNFKTSILGGNFFSNRGAAQLIRELAAIPTSIIVNLGESFNNYDPKKLIKILPQLPATVTMLHLIPHWLYDTIDTFTQKLRAIPASVKYLSLDCGTLSDSPDPAKLLETFTEIPDSVVIVKFKFKVKINEKLLYTLFENLAQTGKTIIVEPVIQKALQQYHTSRYIQITEGFFETTSSKNCIGDPTTVISTIYDYLNLPPREQVASNKNISMIGHSSIQSLITSWSKSNLILPIAKTPMSQLLLPLKRYITTAESVVKEIAAKTLQELQQRFTTIERALPTEVPALIDALDKYLYGARKEATAYAAVFETMETNIHEYCKQFQVLGYQHRI